MLNKLIEKFTKQCENCGKVPGETTFTNNTDRICYVCRFYQYPKIFICCETPVELFHGESEICRQCGKEIIMWGASISVGSPFLSAEQRSGQYIVQVLYQKNGGKEYIAQKINQTQEIRDPYLKDRYIRHYQLLCEISKKERQRIKRKYRI